MNVRNLVARFIERLTRIPATLSIAVVALVLVLHPGASTALQFDRSLIAAGEVWRLATCHLVHWNLEHFQWDFAMFVLLGTVCEWRSRRQFVLCLLGASIAVTATVWLGLPHIETYRGLSGLDTALFAMLAVDLLVDAWRQRQPTTMLVTGALLAALATKTLYEAVTGQTMFVDAPDAGFVPVVFDHLAGAAVGVALAVIPHVHNPKRMRGNPPGKRRSFVYASG